jgi:hypothetical protein
MMATLRIHGSKPHTYKKFPLQKKIPRGSAAGIFYPKKMPRKTGHHHSSLFLLACLRSTSTSSLFIIQASGSSVKGKFAAIRNSKYLPKKPEENRKKRKTERFSVQFFTLFLVLKPSQFSKNCPTSAGSALPGETPH